MMRRLRRFVDRWVYNRDLQESEREVLAVLADGKDREARALGRVAQRTGDEELMKRAEEAHRETIRLTRMVEGTVDLYSYGRASDE